MNDYHELEEDLRNELRKNVSLREDVRTLLAENLKLRDLLTIALLTYDPKQLQELKDRIQKEFPRCP